MHTFWDQVCTQVCTGKSVDHSPDIPTGAANSTARNPASESNPVNPLFPFTDRLSSVFSALDEKANS